MIVPAPVGPPADPPALLRLGRLATLSAAARTVLHAAMSRPRQLAARQELIADGQPAGIPLILLAGWACRTRVLADGRRQILGFILPGDLICHDRHAGPLATTTILALTAISVCRLPQPAGACGAELAEAYARSLATEDVYRFNQIARIGRLTAYERIADLLLELYERLAGAGLADAGTLPFPLTQEVVADTLGLTSVHVNRTLKALRRDGVATVQAGKATIHDPGALAEQIDHRSPRIGGT